MFSQLACSSVKFLFFINGEEILLRLTVCSILNASELKKSNVAGKRFLVIVCKPKRILLECALQVRLA